MRMTKRKQAILDFLSINDKDRLFNIIGETGLFSICSFSLEVFGYYDTEIKPSQRTSLYRTLRGMVEDGLIITRKEMFEDGSSLPNWRTYWHLPEKMAYDLEVLAEWNAGALERRERVLEQMFSRS